MPKWSLVTFCKMKVFFLGSSMRFVQGFCTNDPSFPLGQCNFFSVSGCNRCQFIQYVVSYYLNQTQVQKGMGKVAYQRADQTWCQGSVSDRHWIFIPLVRLSVCTAYVLQVWYPVLYQFWFRKALIYQLDRWHYGIQFFIRIGMKDIDTPIGQTER